MSDFNIPEVEHDNPFEKSTEYTLWLAWGWLEDCGIVEPDDADLVRDGVWTEAMVVSNVDKNFEGGWSAFLQTEADLEVWYLVSTFELEGNIKAVTEKSNFGNTRTRRV